MKDSFGIKKQMSPTGPIRNLIISFSREIKRQWSRDFNGSRLFNGYVLFSKYH